VCGLPCVLGALASHSKDMARVYSG
jgi:hypothetical protein